MEPKNARTLARGIMDRIYGAAPDVFSDVWMVLEEDDEVKGIEEILVRNTAPRTPQYPGVPAPTNSAGQELIPGMRVSLDGREGVIYEYINKGAGVCIDFDGVGPVNVDDHESVAVLDVWQWPEGAE